MKPFFSLLRPRPDGGAIPTLVRWWPGRRAARSGWKGVLRFNWISGAVRCAEGTHRLLPSIQSMLLEWNAVWSLLFPEPRFPLRPALAQIPRKELFS